MRVTAEEALLSVYNPPPDTITDGVLDEHLGPLGFTVYITHYPTSERGRQIRQAIEAALDDDLEREIRSAFQPRQHIASERAATEKLLALAGHSVRSDEAVLADRTFDELRRIFRDRVGGEPRNADDSTRQYFLVADREVFDHFGRAGDVPRYVKVVDVNYNEADHSLPGRPTYLMPQIYWGWAKVSTSSLLFLWLSLDNMDLSRIAPPVGRGEEFPIIDHQVEASTD